MGLQIEVLILVLIIFLFGGIVKGVLGFGLPLITMSFLPMVVPLELALVASALVQPFTNIGQIIQSGRIKIAIKNTWPLVVSLGPGGLAGSWFLGVLDADALIFLIGVMVTLFAIYSLTGFVFIISEKIRTEAGLVIGFLAGVVGALTTLNGNFFILYLLGIETNRTDFRSAIAILFIVSALFISAGFYSVGFLNSERLWLSGFCLLPSFFGMWIGNRVGVHLPTDTFRKIVLAMLLVIGVSFIFRGAGF